MSAAGKKPLLFDVAMATVGAVAAGTCVLLLSRAESSTASERAKRKSPSVSPVALTHSPEPVSGSAPEILSPLPIPPIADVLGKPQRVRTFEDVARSMVRACVSPLVSRFHSVLLHKHAGC